MNNVIWTSAWPKSAVSSSFLDIEDCIGSRKVSMMFHEQWQYVEKVALGFYSATDLRRKLRSAVSNESKHDSILFEPNLMKTKRLWFRIAAERTATAVANTLMRIRPMRIKQLFKKSFAGLTKFMSMNPVMWREDCVNDARNLNKFNTR